MTKTTNGFAAFDGFFQQGPRPAVVSVGGTVKMPPIEFIPDKRRDPWSVGPDVLVTKDRAGNIVYRTRDGRFL